MGRRRSSPVRPLLARPSRDSSPRAIGQPGCRATPHSVRQLAAALGARRCRAHRRSRRPRGGSEPAGRLPRGPHPPVPGRAPTRSGPCCPRRTVRGEHRCGRGRRPRCRGTATTAASAELMRAGVIIGERPLQFEHPIVHAALIGSMTISYRRHCTPPRAASSGSAGPGPELVAIHVLESEPGSDAQAFSTLRGAGELAMNRGAPEVAITLLHVAPWPRRRQTPTSKPTHCSRCRSRRERDGSSRGCLSTAAGRSSSRATRYCAPAPHSPSVGRWDRASHRKRSRSAPSMRRPAPSARTTANLPARSRRWR